MFGKKQKDKLFINSIDIDISTGDILRDQDPRGGRTVYRISLPDGLNRRAHAVSQLYAMSQSDRSMVARINGHSVPQGG